MKLLSVLSAFLFILSYGCSSQKSDMDTGNEYFDKGDYKNALIYFEKECHDNSIGMLHTVGLMYMLGMGAPKNYDKAVFYLDKTGKYGMSAEAFFFAACICSTGGYGVEKNPDAAKCFLESAANRQKPMSMKPEDLLYCELAELLLKSPKYPECLNFYLRMTTKENLFSPELYLGVLYYDGDYVKQNYVEAVRHFKIAAEEGNSSAQLLLAVAYENGNGVEKDLKKAEDIYKGLTKSGDSLAEYCLGVMYYKNGRVEEGEQILKKISDFGAPYAKNFLAYELAKKNQNLELAESMIKDALKKEPENASYVDTYGYILLKKGKNQEALELFLKAEKEGGAEVKSHVGNACFALGDYEKARNCWKESLKLMEDDNPLRKEVMEKLGKPSSPYKN